MQLAMFPEKNKIITLEVANAIGGSRDLT